MGLREAASLEHYSRVAILGFYYAVWRLCFGLLLKLNLVAIMGIYIYSSQYGFLHIVIT